MADELVPLTKREQERLAVLDATIEDGLKSFVELGLALMEVRDRELWRGEYASYEAYLEKRHHLSRRRSNQLVQAAGVGKLFPALNESQSRAVVPIADDPGRVQETVERVEATGKVTAARLTEDVNRQLGKEVVFPASGKLEGEQLVLDLDIGKYERWKAKADESGYTLEEFVDACVEARLAIDGIAETAPPKAEPEPQAIKTVVDVPVAAAAVAGGKVFRGPDPKVKGPTKEKARGRR